MQQQFTLFKCKKSGRKKTNKQSHPNWKRKCHAFVAIQYNMTFRHVRGVWNFNILLSSFCRSLTYSFSLWYLCVDGLYMLFLPKIYIEIYFCIFFIKLSILPLFHTTHPHTNERACKRTRMHILFVILCPSSPPEYWQGIRTPPHSFLLSHCKCEYAFHITPNILVKCLPMFNFIWITIQLSLSCMYSACCATNGYA